MTKHISSTILLLLFFSCGQPHQEKTGQQQYPEFRVQTFKVKMGWGYSVFIDNKEYIRQRFIPAVEGEVPFPSSQQALETGNYVVGKIKRKGNPSLSSEELKVLHVLPAFSGQQD